MTNIYWREAITNYTLLNFRTNLKLSRVMTINDSRFRRQERAVAADLKRRYTFQRHYVVEFLDSEGMYWVIFPNLANYGFLIQSSNHKRYSIKYQYIRLSQITQQMWLLESGGLYRTEHNHQVYVYIYIYIYIYTYILHIFIIYIYNIYIYIHI